MTLSGLLPALDGYVEAVLAHRNQAGKPYMTRGRARGMVAFRGVPANIINTETFALVRLLG